MRFLVNQLSISIKQSNALVYPAYLCGKVLVNQLSISIKISVLVEIKAKNKIYLCGTVIAYRKTIKFNPNF